MFSLHVNGFANSYRAGNLQGKCTMKGQFRYRQIHRNCPQRQIPSLNGGSTQSASRIHQHTAHKNGFASRIHQQTALQNEGSPLKSINIQPPKRRSTSRIHQNTATKRVSASKIQQHTAPQKGSTSRIQQPKGSASKFHQPKGGPTLDFIKQNESARFI